EGLDQGQREPGRIQPPGVRRIAVVPHPSLRLGSRLDSTSRCGWPDVLVPSCSPWLSSVPLRRGAMGHIDAERYRGSIRDLRAFQTPGLETLRRYVRGELPAVPIQRLAGLRATEAGLGKATFTMPVTRWLEDGFGLYWGGVFALLADAPLAAAIWTTLPAGKAVTTSELSLSFVRPMSRKTEAMIGRAETIHSGS